ncbi:MAG: CAP domain-containing protein [Spirochaetales bacterium]|nr:CAP domain-containing protein [Spirochaetales bacterium]
MKTETGIEISFEPDSVRVTEIRDEWRLRRPRYAGSPFLEKPSLSPPYAPGRLRPEYVADGLAVLNFARWLAGLPADVEIDPRLAVQAQHGAVLLHRIGCLCHTPSRPSDMPKAFYAIGYASTSTSNIHASFGATTSLEQAVLGFLDDSDPSNIDKVGHRRWILNPAMRYTAFGYAGDEESSFITLQAFDQTRKDVFIPFVAWPAEGMFPISFFGADQAWSVSLDPRAFDARRSNPSVALTSIGDGRVWKFPGTGGASYHFSTDRTGYGQPFCLVFRPDGVMAYFPGSRWRVEIAGLVDPEGKPSSLAYEVEFFPL